MRRTAHGAFLFQIAISGSKNFIVPEFGKPTKLSALAAYCDTASLALGYSR